MQTFEEAFQPLYETLSDPQARFHGHTMVDELEALQPLADGDLAAEARLYRELAVLQAKRDQPAAFDYAARAMRADEACSALDEEAVFWMNVQCAQISVYDRAGVEKVFSHAARAHDLSLKLGRSEDDQLSLLQDKGLWLHELGRFDEALSVNQEVLRRAEALYGEDAYELNVVLNNLAQNHYERGEVEASKRYLTRRLGIVEASRHNGKVSDTLFQLAVLAFEQGEYAEAKALFRDRLTRAAKLQDKTLISIAKADLSEYYDRLGRARKSRRKE